jgi:hypothetical protein
MTSEYAHLRVDLEELARDFEGIVPKIEAILENRRISSYLAVPNMPEGLEQIITWGPYDDPLPPDDFTEMDGLSLGKLVGFIGNWASYVSAEVTRAKNDYDVYKDYYSVLEAALILFYREGGVAATLSKRYALVDARLCRVRETLRKFEGVYRTAADRYERYYQTSKLLSREQTRRADERRIMDGTDRNPAAGDAFPQRIRR